MPKSQFLCRLEDTLIDMFLSGYPSEATHADASDTTMPVEINGSDILNAPATGW